MTDFAMSGCARGSGGGRSDNMAEKIPMGYPELKDPDLVFDALLGYGMFTDRLPSCFTSEPFLQYIKDKNISLVDKNVSQSYVEYFSSRNIEIPRQFAIPHPKAYLYLCRVIQDHWEEINNHIGQPKEKFNFCHVRKIKNKQHIFEMNYEGFDHSLKEEKNI